MSRHRVLLKRTVIQTLVVEADARIGAYDGDPWLTSTAVYETHVLPNREVQNVEDRVAHTG